MGENVFMSWQVTNASVRLDLKAKIANWINDPVLRNRASMLLHVLMMAWIINVNVIQVLQVKTVIRMKGHVPSKTHAKMMRLVIIREVVIHAHASQVLRETIARLTFAHALPKNLVRILPNVIMLEAQITNVIAHPVFRVKIVKKIYDHVLPKSPVKMMRLAQMLV